MSSSRPHTDRHSVDVPPPVWESVLLTALLICRFLVPTEAPELGETFWLSTAWFGFAAISFWLCARSDEPIGWNFNWCDVAVLMIVVGHLLSGASLFLHGGNLRAAVNVMWQWSSLGVLWGLLRIYLPHRHVYQNVAYCTLTTVIVLSLLGLWQHFYWYPQQAGQIQELTELQSAYESGHQFTQQEFSRYRSLVDQYGSELMSLDERGRQSFLARIRDSVEPIGRFALANSFAALLIAGLMIFVPELMTRFLSWNRTQQFIAIVCLAIILLCLILTKSRTAWIAASIGLAVIVISRWKGNLISSKPARVICLSVIGLLGLLVIFSVATGGLDPEVISEAPKSMQYRLEYWSATTQMLAENLFLGSGPGNFRQHYLQFKLPGASEEIIDPHNLFLDQWANGGLLALFGLIVLLLLTLNNGLRILSTTNVHAASETEQPVHTRHLLQVQFLAYAILAIISTTLGGAFDGQLIWLMILAIVIVSLLTSLGLFQTAPQTGFFAAFLVLAVHLLASGGIEMPAIVQLLFLFSVLTINHSTIGNERKHWILRDNSQRLIAVGCALLLVGSWWTGLIPIETAQSSIALGRESMLSSNITVYSKDRAKHDFEAAALADPLSPEPYQLLAQWSFSDWNASSADSNSDRFEEAVNYQQQSIDRDPDNSSRYLLLGTFWDAKFSRSQVPEDALKAIEAYQKAVELYPNDSMRLARLALILESAGQDATDAATRAVELDRLNESRGHYDKMLSSAARKQLEAIIE